MDNLEYLLGDLERQKDRQIAPLNQQWEWKKQQSRNNMKGYQAQADGRIASVNPSPVSQPSLVGAVAGFAADATGTYMKYRKMKGETK